MSQKSSGSGGWSLRKALVRKVAQAVNAYEKEVSRPAKAAKKSAARPESELAVPDPAGGGGGLPDGEGD